VKAFERLSDDMAKEVIEGIKSEGFYFGTKSTIILKDKRNIPIYLNFSKAR